MDIKKIVTDYIKAENTVRGTGVWANAAERRSPMTADGSQTPVPLTVEIFTANLLK